MFILFFLKCEYNVFLTFYKNIFFIFNSFLLIIYLIIDLLNLSCINFIYILYF